MEIIQAPISTNHMSAMFFEGVVATGEKDGKNYTLKTYQTGELGYNDQMYLGAEIRELGVSGAINDVDIDEEQTVDIYVDKFLVITEEGVELTLTTELLPDENMIFNDFEEAWIGFNNFINNK
jgi:hypothetical protein